jgi:hypothetical protein
MVTPKTDRYRSLIVSGLLALALPAYSGIRPDIPSVDAIKAAEKYWGGFEVYEARMLKEGKDKYEKSWMSLKKNFDKERDAIREEQLDTLKNAAKKYKETIKEHQESSSVSYAQLNLSQILNKLADYYDTRSQETAAIYRSEALGVLEELKLSNPHFAESEAVLYHIALTYESLGLKQKAFGAWNNLAKIASNSQYGIYALVAVGDHLFDTEEPDSAKERGLSHRLLLHPLYFGNHFY